MDLMVKRILIAVGGTGGHIYPALALAEQLKERHPEIYVMFAGGGLEENRYFDRQSYPFRQVACGTFPLKHPLKCLKNLARLFQGVWQSEKVLKEVYPEVVVGFGSYHSLPVLLAAKRRSIPIVLHEANAFPGKVNRLMSRYALATGLHLPVAAQHLKGNTVDVGLPLREGLKKEAAKREEALQYYGLSGDQPTLLIFGGSQGAFSINKLALEAVSLYTGGRDVLQVLHFTGDSNETLRAIKQYHALGVRASVKNFESRMEKAWAIADLALGRAGAGTLAEAVEFEVPTILIPYPHASEDHQSKNADFMVDVVGGGIKMREKETDAQSLSQEIGSFFAYNASKLEHMKKALCQYKSERHQNDLCALIHTLIPS